MITSYDDEVKRRLGDAQGFVVMRNVEMHGDCMTIVAELNPYASLLSAAGAWLGDVIYVVSVYLVYRQFVATRLAIKSSSTQGAYDLWIKLDEFFVEHSSLKPYFYERKVIEESASEDVRQKIKAAAEMVLDCMANVFHHLPNFDADESEAYGNFLKEMYQTQPTLKAFVDQNNHWYPNRFIAFLRSQATWKINPKPS